MRYDIVGEHGRGGLGRVMHARDLELGRSVAIKELLKPSDAAELRFFREAMITARLEHPSIVPVHEAGRWPDGTPFYAMKLVAGRPLRALIETGASLSDRLRLLPHVVAVAEAIAYAHSKGIIHRDLKPSNVIIGDFGETVVIDWGLAKSVNDPDDDATAPVPTASRLPHATEDGQVLGTASYMPPEQAVGQTVDQRSDVYAIGALLYHVVSGHAPYHDEPSNRALERVIEGPPPPLHTLSGPTIGLRAVIEKAMARSPDERYPDASALASDLRLFAAGHLVTAHHYSVTQLVRHWSRRFRPLLVAAALAILVAGTTAVLSFQRVVAERDQATRAELSTQHKADELAMSRAESLLTTDPTAAMAVARTLRDSPAHGSRAALVTAAALGTGIARLVLRTKDATVHSLFWPPGDDIIFYGNQDTLTRVSTATESATLVAGLGRFGSAVVATDGSLVARSDGDARIRVERPGHTDVLIESDSLRGVTMMTASSDGQTLAATSLAGAVSLIDMTTLRVVPVHPPDHVRKTVVLSPKGRFVAVCNQRGELNVYNTTTAGKTVTGRCDGLEFVPLLVTDESTVFAGDRNGEVTSSTPAGRRTLHTLDSAVRGLSLLDDTLVAVSTTGHVVALAGHSTTPRWSLQLGRSVSTTAASTQLVALGHDSGTITVIDRDGHTVTDLMGHKVGVEQIVFSADGDALASSASSELRVWTLPRTYPVSQLLAPTDLFLVAASPDGSIVATTARDGAVRACNMQEMQCKTTAVHDSYAVGLAWTQDGSRIVSAGWDGVLAQYDFTTSHVTRFQLGDHVTASLEGLLGDDENALVYVNGQALEIYSVSTGKRIGALPRDIRGLSVSDNRRVLALLRESGRAAIYDVRSDLRELSRIECAATSQVALSPLGDKLLCAGNGRVSIYRTSDSALLLRGVLEPSSAPRRATFSRDGERAAISFSNGGVAIYSIRGDAGWYHQPFNRPAVDIVFVNDLVIAANSTGAIWAATPGDPSKICFIQLDDRVADLDVSPDGRTLFAASDTGRLHTARLEMCTWTNTATTSLRTASN